jgi:hypothetical protein
MSSSDKTSESGGRVTPQTSNRDPTAKPTQTATTQHAHHHEDRLGRTWRSLGSSVVLATTKAAVPKASVKEVDEAVVGFLRTRQEWGRLISYLEAKLEAKAKEMETLQHYVRSQPTMGIRRKRKREETDRTAVAKSQEEVVTQDGATSTPPTPPTEAETATTEQSAPAAL